MKATLVTDLEASKHIPGAFMFFTYWAALAGRTTGVAYICPCGCGTFGELRFVQPSEVPRSPTYLWDGNREAPTIAPEVHHIVAGHMCWAGVLQSGVWIGESQNDAGAAQAPPNSASD